MGYRGAADVPGNSIDGKSLMMCILCERYGVVIQQVVIRRLEIVLYRCLEAGGVVVRVGRHEAGFRTFDPRLENERPVWQVKRR